MDYLGSGGGADSHPADVETDDETTPLMSGGGEVVEPPDGGWGWVIVAGQYH